MSAPSVATDRARAGERRTASVFVREHAWTLAIWVSMVAWTGVLLVIARDAYVNFREGRFDLGNMVQAVWSTAHGRPLEITDGTTGEQIVRLGGHADPFLVLLTPVWALWPSPLSLAFAQIAVVSLGALPVFWLGRRRLGDERAAGLLALAYLAYPWIATSAVASIHPVTFAITFFLFCIWFLETERLVLFTVFAALAMSTGELMGVPVAALGVWFAVVHGARLVGAAIALAGIAWTFLAIYVVVPAYRGGDSAFFGFYGEVGGSPQGVVRKLFEDPGVVLGALVESHDIVYLVWLGVPLLFLFLLSPGLALVAIPQLLANGLSDFRSMTDPRYHSLAAIFPFLIAATVFGIGRLRPSRQTSTAAAVLVCSAAIALFVGPWARAVGMTPLGGRESVSPARVAALSAAIALVPDEAAVSVSNVAGGHLSARRYIYSIPKLGRATWVVVDRSDPWVVSPDSPILTNHPEVVAAFVTRLDGDSSWRRVFDRSGIAVYERRTAP